MAEYDLDAKSLLDGSCLVTFTQANIQESDFMQKLSTSIACAFSAEYSTIMERYLRQHARQYLTPEGEIGNRTYFHGLVTIRPKEHVTTNIRKWKWPKHASKTDSVCLGTNIFDELGNAQRKLKTPCIITQMDYCPKRTSADTHTPVRARLHVVGFFVYSFENLGAVSHVGLTTLIPRKALHNRFDAAVLHCVEVFGLGPGVTGIEESATNEPDRELPSCGKYSALDYKERPKREHLRPRFDMETSPINNLQIDDFSLFGENIEGNDTESMLKRILPFIPLVPQQIESVIDQFDAHEIDIREELISVIQNLIELVCTRIREIALKPEDNKDDDDNATVPTRGSSSSLVETKDRERIHDIVTILKKNKCLIVVMHTIMHISTAIMAKENLFRAKSKPSLDPKKVIEVISLTLGSLYKEFMMVSVDDDRDLV
ncbi:hypothetical protein KDA14_05255, partial [Candidatus Saccharibacteria bacterium]|nr:hypothetical protein [Candidatus Saccharibacteria bacterium]